jgi:hypothetical protein
MANIFVDFSAANNGDGTAFGQAGSPGGVGAKNTLVGLTPSIGDFVWIRRAGTLTITANLAPTVPNVYYIGWPASADTYYSIRPSAAQATWDADSNTYAQITSSTANIQINLNANQSVMHRVKYSNTNTGNTTQCFQLAGNNSELRYCRAESSSTSGSLVDIVRNAGQQNFILDCICATAATTAGTYCFSNRSGAQNATTRNCSVIDIGTQGTAVACGFYSICNATYQDCSVTLSGASSYGWYFDANSTIKINNCSANLLGGSSIALQAGAATINMDARNFSGTASRIILANIGVTNTIQTVLNLNNFTFSPSIGTPAILMTGGVLSLNNVIFAAGCTFDIDIGQGGVVTARGTRFKTDPIINPSSRPYLFTSADHMGRAGAWKSQSYDGACETVAAYRTGGEAFSVRMEPYQAEAWREGGLILGPWGFETLWASIPSAGSKTITVYAAHKLFGTAPTRAELYMEYDYYASAGSGIRTTSTTYDSSGSALTSDSSNWNNDSSLNAFKFTTTVTVGAACIIPIRIFLNKAIQNAYVLIDPLVVVS